MRDEDVFDFAINAGRFETIDELYDVYRSIAADFGYDKFIVGGIPIGRSDLDPLALLNGWPVEWYKRYAKYRYSNIDPVCLYATRTKSAFDWSEVPESYYINPSAKRVMNEAAEFGLRSGMIVPCESVKYWNAAVSLANDQPDFKLATRDKMKLAFVSSVVAGAAERIRGVDDPVTPLTMRESEVLTRTARGFSASRLSDVLGISHHTAITHLNNIRKKFGVSTTMQAVVEALRRGMIAP